MSSHAVPQLALYHFVGCGYCSAVRSVADRYGIPLESRSTRDPEHRAALQQAVGRTRVPVLRIQEGDSVRWLPESRDIIAYLKSLAGVEPSATGA